jgi:hypothetical protein
VRGEGEGLSCWLGAVAVRGQRPSVYRKSSDTVLSERACGVNWYTRGAVSEVRSSRSFSGRLLACWRSGTTRPPPRQPALKGGATALMTIDSKRIGEHMKEKNTARDSPTLFALRTV